VSAAFVQSPPRLQNFFSSDLLLAGFLRRKLPPDLLAALTPEFVELGAEAAGPLSALQQADRLSEPVLTQWDAWGNRIDRIEVSPLWREAERRSVRYGLTAVPYERSEHEWSRLRQFVLVYMFHPVTDVYSCPLAMTDGAARALTESGNRTLIARAVPRLTARDPAQFWTSGQWMTEASGGSDVGLSQTVAEQDEHGGWRLSGRKWFTSAATSQMALTLARPAGNGPGGSGLAMFYVECRDDAGQLNGIRIDRLKDKLGTRKVPTAELELAGTRAELVTTKTGGTRAIEPMLQITRCWNSVCAAAAMRHAHRLAADYARRRIAFGAPLAELPLHRETLLDLEAECAGAFLLTFWLIEILGRSDAGQSTQDDALLLRLLTPLVKLTTGKQAVGAVSEAIEAFGGAGYVEDTGLPAILRDTQVLPIWEGTTNVLALDLLLRAEFDRALPPFRRRLAAALDAARGAGLGDLADAGAAALDAATRWAAATHEPAARQAGARRLALTLGRTAEVALAAEHAAALPAGPERSAVAGLAGRLWRAGINFVGGPQLP
jgi:alkylation response protein AidB-like acyl-CoA dehydrogenase